MRKVILALAVSVGGYIARENGDVDWLSMEDLSEAAEESKEFFKTIDAVIFGRKTFAKGLELGGGAIPGKINYVLSHILSANEHKNINIISENVKDFVENLKQQDGKNILLMGGGNLAKTFFEEKLIDMVILGIQSKIIGKGIPLFLPHDCQTELELIDIKTRQSGTVQVTYLVK